MQVQSKSYMTLTVEDILGCTGMNNCKRINAALERLALTLNPYRSLKNCWFVIFGLYSYVLIFKKSGLRHLEKNQSTCIRSRNLSAMFGNVRYLVSYYWSHLCSVHLCSGIFGLTEKLSCLLLLCSHLTLGSCLV